MSMDPLSPLQQAADETILSWPGVHPKQVFGHRGYMRDRRMFAFLAADGLSIKVASTVRRKNLYTSGDVRPFTYRDGMAMEAWPVFPLGSDDELATALSEARLTYEG